LAEFAIVGATRWPVRIRGARALTSYHHVGLTVDDIETAIGEIGSAFGKMFQPPK
jgi:hypothetical protein